MLAAGKAEARRVYEEMKHCNCNCIVIVIFKQGVRSAQADFQRSPVYITHTTNSNIYTYKLAIHIIHTKKYNNKNITTKHRHKTKKQTTAKPVQNKKKSIRIKI